MNGVNSPGWSLQFEGRLLAEIGASAEHFRMSVP
jgi:hypothetical protein